jgi:hypothetical protein
MAIGPPLSWLYPYRFFVLSFERETAMDEIILEKET